jgi:hypothetical protein
MQKNLNLAVARIAAIKKYQKAIIITIPLIVLQLSFGSDATFCFINIIWLFA